MTSAQAYSMTQLVPIVMIIGVFYFIIIRPQQKKEKEHQKMISELGKNTDIVTTSGIHGTIVSVKEKSFVVRVDDNVKIEFEKNCVAYVKKPQTAESK